ncbi:MAG: hypothetical protein Fur0010_21200 [Bdellovibrio sp.]
MSEKLKENQDFYMENGNMVFTESFLKKRGFCCQSGCRHCPWKFSERFDPNYPAELQASLNLDQCDIIDFEDEDDF